MTDNDTKTDDTTEETSQPKQEEKSKPHGNDDTDWKAEARKWQKRAQENFGAAEKLAKLEDAEKSAEQRLTEQIQALTKRAEAAEVDALRRRVAADRGLPADIVEFLTGTDEDSVVTQADKLAERLAAAAPPPPPASRPASLRSGNGEKTADTGLSPAQLAESVIRSRDGT